MATRGIFLPGQAEYPATNYPANTLVGTTGRREVLAFDDTTDEACWFTTVAPAGLSGTQTMVISFMMASDTNTAHNVCFEVLVEAVTSGDATDLDAGTSFDTTNFANTTIPGTAGYMKQLTVTLTNADSMAAGDLVRIQVNRDANGTNATDDATGDCYVLACEWKDAV